MFLYEICGKPLDNYWDLWAQTQISDLSVAVKISESVFV